MHGFRFFGNLKICILGVRCERERERERGDFEVGFGWVGVDWGGTVGVSGGV